MTGFPEFWSVYPRKIGRGAAEKSFAKALKGGAQAQAIVRGAIKYRDSPDRDHDNIRYTANPATWLNQERWRDDYSVAPSVRLAPVISLTERFEDQPEGITFREWLDRYATPEEKAKARRLGLGRKV